MAKPSDNGNNDNSTACKYKTFNIGGHDPLIWTEHVEAGDAIFAYMSSIEVLKLSDDLGFGITLNTEILATDMFLERIAGNSVPMVIMGKSNILNTDNILPV